MKNQIFHFPIVDIESSAIQGSDIEGANKKQVLILLTTTQKTNESIQLLRNILKAIGLEYPDDIHLLTVSDTASYSLLSYLSEYRPKQIIVFGVPPSKLNLNLDVVRYQIIQLHQTQWIFADALTNIAQSKPLKKSLWEALKKLRLS